MRFSRATRVGKIMISETFQELIERANFYARYEKARSLHGRHIAYSDVEGSNTRLFVEH